VELIIGRIGEVPSGTRYRVLVDRLWPRGVRRDQELWDERMRDVAPSAALRQWYGHDATRWPAFRERYRAELAAGGGPSVSRLLDLARTRPVALLTATRRPAQSHVAILAEFLAEQDEVGQAR